MILVFSEQTDVTTDLVMEWLLYYGADVLRINEEECSNIVTAVNIGNESATNIQFKAGERSFELADVTAVWFRRGTIRFESGLQQMDLPAEVKKQFGQFLSTEDKTLHDFVVAKLLEKPSLNDSRHYNANKLLLLELAKAERLLVPQTIVCRDPADVFRALGTDGEQIITKPVQDVRTLHYCGGTQGTHVIKLADAGALPPRFYYSSFQRLIERKMELRIFFLDTDCYTLAILHREPVTDGKLFDERTRMVPYTLPDIIRQKLLRVFRKAGLNCGSADMIVDTSDNYYFLEVNPVGQMDHVSRLGNFYLEQKIAQYLIHAAKTQQQHHHQPGTTAGPTA